MHPLPGVDDQERGPTFHGSYSHTRNSEKVQVAGLALRVGGATYRLLALDASC